MKPVFMTNDLGGVVYVGKNQLHLCFSKGVKHHVNVKTKEILTLIKAQNEQNWENHRVLIEPMYMDLSAPVLRTYTQITVKNTDQDHDIAHVFQKDLLDALIEIEDEDI